MIHIVGGGSRNQVLNQFVADSTGRKVIAGPTEATAIGNILVQAMAAGAISGSDGGAGSGAEFVSAPGYRAAGAVGLGGGL